EYLGIGPAAHSYYNGERFFTERDIEGFIHSERQVTFREDNEGSRYGGFEEYAMLRLRLAEGLDLGEFEARGGNVRAFLTAAEKIPKDYYKYENGILSLTPKGFLVSNAIISTLLG
ncbi:MAG: coproporphyrinogen III oxidase family protein, partial [Ruminiclostridium sp.]|nr:coproporphyrinogen III oxidase family protein [Ruminiclostridium sp.]